MVTINRARSLIGNVDYHLRVSNKARNVTLKVNRNNGLEVVVPSNFDFQLLPDILSSRANWIERQLQRFEALPGKFEVDWPPVAMHLRGAGRDFRLEYRQVSGARIRLNQDGGFLQIDHPEYYDNEDLASLFVKWLKKLAQRHCERIANELSEKTGLKFRKVVVRGQKTRWGSYSSRGTLSLNYKLLFLPEHLLRYVILHELAHSVHMNHSAEFWCLLESIDPEARKNDKQLLDAWQYLPAWIE